ncbi:hypothetical protein PVAR5_0966 [Paecilomyces variotii No. 5]|uniref:Uncharacterized protein n=1 Tax=Byssochlamys spectabilis (strain No. 5 / NBRC 109023) TaxID=1356009 RepID=V5HSI2_BYSSN|nr:hypothetical protein PVAR5_0966 [Paecilomyces variotii No. 5]
MTTQDPSLTCYVGYARVSPVEDINMCHCVNEPIHSNKEQALDHALKLFLDVRLAVNIRNPEVTLHPPLSVSREVRSIRDMSRLFPLSLADEEFTDSEVYRDRIRDRGKRLIERWTDGKRVHVVNLTMLYEVMNNLAHKVPTLEDIRTMRDCIDSETPGDLQMKQNVFDPWLCFLFKSLKDGDSEMEQTMLIELERADYSQICEIYVDFAKVKYYTHTQLLECANADGSALLGPFED